MSKLIETIVISQELLQAYSPISLNTAEIKLYPFLIHAQNDIRLIIGIDLMEELITEVESGVIKPQNQALLIKIAPALSALAIYYALPSLAYQIQQKGITKEHSENSESVDMKELNYLRLDCKNQADSAIEILVKYLCSCAELYPLYDSSKCGCNNAHKEPCQIYFPSTNNCKCKCNG